MLVRGLYVVLPTVDFNDESHLRAWREASRGSACQHHGTSAPALTPPRFAGEGTRGFGEPIHESLFARIRIHILHSPREDAALAFLPELRRQQIGMMFEERGADARIAKEERAELLGEHVVFFHPVPRFV